MKNIHLIPTDKPSRLHEYGDIWFKHKEPTECFRNYNIYITSDEEIKEECYWLYICHINGLDYGYNGNPIVKNNLPNSWFEKLHDKKNYKKIILTTDQDLIKDGVQSIDDDFLEWFVNNPNCEWAEVKLNSFSECHMKGYDCTCYDTADQSICSLYYPNYKIIIPKEEPKPIHQQIIDAVGGEDKFREIAKINPKKQSLEEIAERLNLLGRELYALKLGAKYQQEQERMYSEEEVLVLLHRIVFL